MRVYTDGACRNNIGGWAWYNADNGEWRHGVETSSTNQRMELKAALEAINEHFLDADLVIVSDSRYVVDCFGEKWWAKWVQNGWLGTKGGEIVNRDLWEPLLEIVQDHGNVKFEWVKGHNGDPGNEKADELAVGAVLNHQKESKKHGKRQPTAKSASKRKDEATAGDGVHRGGGTAAGRETDGVAEASSA